MSECGGEWVVNGGGGTLVGREIGRNSEREGG